MQRRKLIQFGLILSCILSLLVSSLSVCVCSHHPGKAETKFETEAKPSSCHEHSAETSSEQADDSDSEDIVRTPFSEAGCCCMQAAPNVFAKSETVKPDKQILMIASTIGVEISVVLPTVVADTSLSKPLYLSDSFYNLSRGRAPPQRL